MKRILLIAALCLFGSLPARADVLTIHANQFFSGFIDGPYDTSPQRFTDFRTGNDYGVISLSPTITDNHLPQPPAYNPGIDTQILGYRLTLQASGGNSLPYRVNYGICNVGGTCGGSPSFSNSPQFLSEEYNSFSFGLFIMPIGDYSFDPNDITATVDLPDGYHVRGIAAVPEPSTWLMMLLGFAALAGLLQLQYAGRSVVIDREALAIG